MFTTAQHTITYEASFSFLNLHVIIIHKKVKGKHDERQDIIRCDQITNTIFFSHQLITDVWNEVKGKTFKTEFVQHLSILNMESYSF